MPPRPLLKLLIAALLLLMPVGAIAAGKPAPKAKTSAPAKPVARPAPAASSDWTKVVTLTPSGSFILGNPDARTKLVEYFSYTCPHCADFAKEANPELRAGIKTGQLSLEYRNFIRDGFDLAAALTARCGGAARFLRNHDLIYQTYDTWMAKAEDYAQAHKDAADNLDKVALFQDIADKLGLIALVAGPGMTPAAVKACIADPKAQAAILALTAGAWDAAPDFEGTPSFMLGGKMIPKVHAWSGLKPLLPALPGSGN